MARDYNALDVFQLNVFQLNVLQLHVFQLNEHISQLKSLQLNEFHLNVFQVVALQCISRCWITSLGQLLIDPGKQIGPRLHVHPPSQEGLNAEAWNSLVTTTHYELVIIYMIMPRALFCKVAQCPKQGLNA